MAVLVSYWNLNVCSVVESERVSVTSALPPATASDTAPASPASRRYCADTPLAVAMARTASSRAVMVEAGKYAYGVLVHFTSPLEKAKFRKFQVS